MTAAAPYVGFTMVENMPNAKVPACRTSVTFSRGRAFSNISFAAEINSFKSCVRMNTASLDHYFYIIMQQTYTDLMKLYNEINGL